MELVHFVPPSQRRLAVLAAQAEGAPVLIYGQSGTGRSALARWIHSNGPRAALPLVVADHNQSLAQQIPAAQGGSFLIAEVGEWPLAEQKILLEFLKTRSIPHPERNGTRLLVNARIIATTSSALEGRAQSGLFNSELLQRLNVFRIEMPDLNQRKEEFEDIACGIVKEITRELHREHIRSITEAAWTLLKGYTWPGNLRELRNVLRYAVIQCKTDGIDSCDLPDLGCDRIDFKATREEFEKIYITELLKTFDWQIDRTCEVNRLDKEVLLKKIKKYGLDSVSDRLSP